MHELEAHARFGRRKDRSILEGDFTWDGADVWPAAATAAAILSGQLEDALTDDDLDRAVDAFFELVEMGGIWTREEAQEKMNEVGAQVLQSLMEHGEMMGWDDDDTPDAPQQQDSAEPSATVEHPA